MKYLLSTILLLFTLPLKADSMQGEIDHVVVLMLENRSFDNIFAWLYGSDNPPSYFIPPTTNPEFLGLTEETLGLYTNDLKDSSGNLIYSVSPIKGIPSVLPSYLLNSPQSDPNEFYPHIMHQIYGDQNTPNMKGFLQDYAELWYEKEWLEKKTSISSVMETYTENEFPIFYSLARHYAVSDSWFSSVPTQTNPNRAFAACGTSLGQTHNGFLGKSSFNTDTIWNRIEELSPGTSWSIYWQTDMLPWIIPGPFTGPNNFPNMSHIANLESHYQKIDTFHDQARNGTLPQFCFLEPQLTSNCDLSAAIPNADILVGNNLLFGFQGNDLHPPADVRTCENFLANIYTSLIANPESWQRTLLVITFDEHGGLFDHVIPPPAVPPDGFHQNGFGFNSYGVRVPAVFISPKINQGTIVRSNDPATPFDHTSLIATILQWLNIDKSQWNLGNRAPIAPTFDTVITQTTPRSDAVVGLPSLRDDAINLQIGDAFYLHDGNGNYLTKSGHLARCGSADGKMLLQFSGGSGPITHGSFAFIQSLETDLESTPFLESTLFDDVCYFESNTHNSQQWWTIKSLQNPFLGAPIAFGDLIYLESHSYLNALNALPGRLTKSWSLLTTKPISDPNSPDHYWIIEKPTPIE